MSPFETNPEERKRLAQAADEEATLPETGLTVSGPRREAAGPPPLPRATSPAPAAQAVRPWEPRPHGSGSGAWLALLIGLAALAVIGLGVGVVGIWLLARTESRAAEAEAREQELAQRQRAQENLRQLQLPVRPPGDGAAVKQDMPPAFQQILPFIEQGQGIFLAPDGKLANDPSLPPEAKRLGELLNVRFRAVDPTLGKQLGLAPGQGLVVASVHDNWRAFRPNDLLPHDIVLQLGATPVKAAEAARLVEVVTKAEARIDAAVFREGRRLELKGVPVLRKAEEHPLAGKP